MPDRKSFGLKRGFHENGSESKIKSRKNFLSFHSIDSIWRIKSLVYLSENSTCGLHGTIFTSFPYLDTYMSGPCEVLTFVKVYPFTKVTILTSSSYYVGHSILKFFYLLIVIDPGFCPRIKPQTHLNLDIII
jgi:hypothetical protein